MAADRFKGRTFVAKLNRAHKIGETSYGAGTVFARVTPMVECHPERIVAEMHRGVEFSVEQQTLVETTAKPEVTNKPKT